MLYVTTRDSRDAYTAQRVLRENRAADGGFYLPLHMRGFTPEEIGSLADKSFGENVAMVLNRLFNLHLTGWDVDFCIGRYPARLSSLPHRILVGECWHNPQWSYQRIVNNLTALMSEEAVSGNWVKIAVRVAVLFGLFGQLQHSGVNSADVSVVSGDFSAPISAWYARQWGLPIGNIICCCNENSALWNLFCHGQLRTDGLSIPTSIPEADVVIPEDLERLIYACGGRPEVQRYLDACRQGCMYIPGDSTLAKMRSGLFISVVSSKRLEDVVPGVYRTSGYILSPGTALAYAGLLDYRAKTGETRHSVVLSQTSPRQTLEPAARLMDVSPQILLEWLER